MTSPSFLRFDIEDVRGDADVSGLLSDASANSAVRPDTSGSSCRSGWGLRPAHKFTRANDSNNLSALSRNFFRPGLDKTRLSATALKAHCQ